MSTTSPRTTRKAAATVKAAPAAPAPVKAAAPAPNLADIAAANHYSPAPAAPAAPAPKRFRVNKQGFTRGQRVIAWHKRFMPIPAPAIVTAAFSGSDPRSTFVPLEWEDRAGSERVHFTCVRPMTADELAAAMDRAAAPAAA